MVSDHGLSLRVLITLLATMQFVAQPQGPLDRTISLFIAWTLWISPNLFCCLHHQAHGHLKEWSDLAPFIMSICMIGYYVSSFGHHGKLKKSGIFYTLKSNSSRETLSPQPPSFCSQTAQTILFETQSKPSVDVASYVSRCRTFNIQVVLDVSLKTNNQKPDNASYAYLM